MPILRLVLALLLGFALTVPASAGPKKKVLLIGQPTRGVDIGAIEFIHRQLIQRREADCAILLVSVELDEVMALADRILVMCGGRIVGELTADEADERKLGLLMANVEGRGASRPVRPAGPPTTQ